MPHSWVRHTNHLVLSPANRADFQAFVVDLLKRGHREEAAKLWDSVFEVIHRVWWDGPLIEVPELAPMRTVVCTDPECRRCQDGRGGFIFPFLGAWSARGVVIPPDVPPAAAWEHHHRNNIKMDALLVEIYSSGLEVADICPPLWDVTLSRTQSAFGHAGLLDLRTQWRIWQWGCQIWQDTAAGPFPSRSAAIFDPRRKAQRAIRTWMASTAEGDFDGLPQLCEVCAAPASRCYVACGHGLCRSCYREGARCCDLARGGVSSHVQLDATDAEQLVAGFDDPWDAA